MKGIPQTRLVILTFLMLLGVKVSAQYTDMGTKMYNLTRWDPSVQKATMDNITQQEAIDSIENEMNGIKKKVVLLETIIKKQQSEIADLQKKQFGNTKNDLNLFQKIVHQLLGIKS